MAATLDGELSIIDFSEWIHPNEIKGTKATKDKPEVKGYAFWRKQHPKGEHPIDYLRRMEFITPAQQWAANFLLRMRQCALLRLDTARMGEVLKDKQGRCMEDGVVLDGDYIYILQHRLSKDDANIVEDICWRAPISTQWIELNESHIKRAFQCLLAVLDEMYSDAIKKP